jgi:hypothetical protein
MPVAPQSRPSGGIRPDLFRPVLQNFLDEQRKAHRDITLPDPPQTGTLDIRQVLLSPYFFAEGSIRFLFNGRSFHQTGFPFYLQKRIRIGESKNVAFRVDSQNIFNHPTPGAPSG